MIVRERNQNTVWKALQRVRAGIRLTPREMKVMLFYTDCTGVVEKPERTPHGFWADKITALKVGESFIIDDFEEKRSLYGCASNKGCRIKIGYLNSQQIKVTRTK